MKKLDGAYILTLITIFVLLFDGYSTLATKDDLTQVVSKLTKVSNFRFAEQTINTNNLHLSNYDLIKKNRDLTDTEQRHKESLIKSNERVEKAQEAMLSGKIIIN